MRPLTEDERKLITTLTPDALCRMTRVILKLTKKSHLQIDSAVYTTVSMFLQEAKGRQQCGQS